MHRDERITFRKGRFPRTIVFAAAWALLLTACATPANPAPEATPTAEPATYPVPDGCPTAEEFGTAYLDEPGRFDSLTVSLLDAEVSHSLPEGGCAYASKEVSVAGNSSETYRTVIVAYFNQNEPAKLSDTELESWAVNAGGYEVLATDFEGNQLDRMREDFLELPVDFSGWTGSWASWSGDFFFGSEEIPEFTQRDHALVRFALDEARVNSLVQQAAAGTENYDPTLALGQGLAATYSTEFSIEDEDGYTAVVQVSGRLQPWSAELANSAPGEFEAVSSASVGSTQRNTTAERNTDTAGIQVLAIYPLGSAACTRYNNSGISTEGSRRDEPSFCYVKLGGVGIQRLSPAQEITVPENDRELGLGPFDESGSALAELNAPISVYAIFGAVVGRTFNDWSSDRGCQVSGAFIDYPWAVSMDGWPDVLCG